MRLRPALALLLCALALVALWRLGAFSALAAEAAALQRAMQNALAGSVRALRAGEPWALASLLGAAAFYGVAHAAGPGHGKALLGAAAAGTRASAARLAGVALAASLAQGAVAVAVVYGALALAGGISGAWIARSDLALAPLGHAMLAGVGCWLVWRGFRALRPAAAPHACGHGCAHGAVAAQAADVDLRAALALIAAVAVRPCGGAMLTLAVAWGAGAPVAGALAVLAMALGTAAVTIAAALLAVGLRETALSASGAALARASGALQLGVGALAMAVGAAGLAGGLRL